MSTREAVLAALKRAAPGDVSGEVLAASLGVSRVAVAKHVAALRDAGYEIAAVPGSGYRLASIPDLPLPSEVAPLVRSARWSRLEGGGSTGSTNDDARALARSGAPEGTVVLASRQTSGRGRLGRAWESPEGGAYLSFVLRPPVAPAHVASLALAVALGVARGLESLGVAPRLKWPNDVLLGEGKLAGVLLEMSAETDRVEWVVAGVGVNVRRPAVAQPGATYLADEVADVRLAQVAAAVLDGVDAAYEAWLGGGFSAIRAEYEARFALRGDDVRVSEMTGGVRAAGIVEGVDDEGRLLVREAGGVVAVSAGEVTLRH